MNFDEREKKLDYDTLSAIVILKRISWETEELIIKIDRFTLKFP